MTASGSHTTPCAGADGLQADVDALRGQVEEILARLNNPNTELGSLADPSSGIVPTKKTVPPAHEVAYELRGLATRIAFVRILFSAWPVWFAGITVLIAILAAGLASGKLEISSKGLYWSFCIAGFILVLVVIASLFFVCWGSSAEGKLREIEYISNTLATETIKPSSSGSAWAAVGLMAGIWLGGRATRKSTKFKS